MLPHVMHRVDAGIGDGRGVQPLDHLLGRQRGKALHDDRAQLGPRRAAFWNWWRSGGPAPVPAAAAPSGRTAPTPARFAGAIGNGLAAGASTRRYCSLVFSFDPFMVHTFQHLHWIAVGDGLIWAFIWLRRETFMQRSWPMRLKSSWCIVRCGRR